MVEGYGEPRRYIPEPEKHHHFRCINGYTMVDFDSKPNDKKVVPKDIEKRYTVLKKKVLSVGYSKNCRKK